MMELKNLVGDRKTCVRERMEKWETGQKPRTSFRHKLMSIRGRCNYPNHVSYSHYGAKGIKCLLTVDDLIFLWRRDKAWEFKHPEIDRIDGKGHYKLSNCRYIDRSVNCRRQENYVNGSPRPRRILQMSKIGKVIKEWPSVESIHRVLGIDRRHIHGATKGIRKTHAGFIWVDIDNPVPFKSKSTT